MMRKYAKILVTCVTLLLASTFVDAREDYFGLVGFDKTICDFGDVSLSDGPLSCTFNVTNISSKPIAIYNITSTCGCTEVKWTREPLQPGKSGKISIVYSNNEGPYPFDKNITVYISGAKAPVILKVRGVCHDKKLSLKEMYPIVKGPIGYKSEQFKCGNLQQGGSRTDFANIANLSSKPLNVSFKNISEGLTVSVSPNPIPVGKTARLHYTVKADRNHWGKNWYHATPIVNGTAYSPLDIWAFTKESFPEMTTSQKAHAPRPMFETSTYSFGKIKRGRKVVADFHFSNTGKETLKIYKVDVDAQGASQPIIPDVAPGAKASFKVELDTSKCPAGETAIIVTLTTNSPLRPIVNLFIVGWLE